MSDSWMTRRSFVAAGSAIVPGLALPADADPKAANGPADFSFLVVSDTHLGRNNSDAPAKQWERTARELDAAAGDFVLHLGDIVDGGREAQYAVYKEIRKAIRKPVHEIPGNHDPRELFERHLRAPIDLAFDHKGVRFLLLNNSRTDDHDGYLDDQQLAWLGEHIAAASAKSLSVILCMHVPAHENKHPDRGWYIKPSSGQAKLYGLIQKHRDVVLAMLHGHFHNGIRGWDDHTPVHEIVFPSALYNQDRRLIEQQAPGYNLREWRPGFVEVRLQREGLRLRYRPIGAAASVERLCPLRQRKS